MAISYKKFRVKLAEYGIKPVDIQKEANISWSILVKMNKDQPVNLSSLEEICRFFFEKYNDNCNFGDLVDYIPDK